MKDGIMVIVTLNERLRRLKIWLWSLPLWLSARSNTPKSWFAGGYSRIKVVRFSLVVLALLDFSAVALGNPVWNYANYLSLWFGLVEAGYIIIAVVYLLGLRMWYGPNVAFLLLSAFINLYLGAGSDINPLGSLGSHGFNFILSLTWIYLVLVGLIIMRYDKGSKINELLAQS